MSNGANGYLSSLILSLGLKALEESQQSSNHDLGAEKSQSLHSDDSRQQLETLQEGLRLQRQRVLHFAGLLRQERRTEEALIQALQFVQAKVQREPEAPVLSCPHCIALTQQVSRLEQELNSRGQGVAQ